MRPDQDDIAIEILYDASQGTVFTAPIAMPEGLVELMGEITERGRSLRVAGVHVSVLGPPGLLTRSTMDAIAWAT